MDRAGHSPSELMNVTAEMDGRDWRDFTLSYHSRGRRQKRHQAAPGVDQSVGVGDSRATAGDSSRDSGATPETAVRPPSDQRPAAAVTGWD